MCCARCNGGIAHWRATEGPERELIFRQEHPPGEQALSDFTDASSLAVMIDGTPFPHLLYHFWLAFSGWQYVKAIQGGESFTALTEGLQEALWQRGAVPSTHRTDRLSAAYRNLRQDDAAAAGYRAFCDHYGLQPTRNNPGVIRLIASTLRGGWIPKASFNARSTVFRSRKQCNRVTFFYNTSTRSADLADGTKSNNSSGADDSRSSRFLETMYLARCNSQLGEQTASENNWQRSLEAAQGDARKLITLAQYAEQNKETEMAEVAYNNAAAITPRLRLAWDGRLRLAQASRDTKKIHAVLANMLALWPDDLAIQNDEAYSRLLLCPPAGPETKRAGGDY